MVAAKMTFHPLQGETIHEYHRRLWDLYHAFCTGPMEKFQGTIYQSACQEYADMLCQQLVFVAMAVRDIDKLGGDDGATRER